MTFKSDYNDIFNQRGLSYHKAMTDYPTVRDVEFNHIVEWGEIEDGQVICDLLSGGGYLKNYIDKDVKLISLESSEVFFNCSDTEKLLIKDGILPLESNSVDSVICLAGVHHIENKDHLYKEVYRILRPGGKFMLGDVFHESKVAKFLEVL